jgi:hypothetical protein
MRVIYVKNDDLSGGVYLLPNLPCLFVWNDINSRKGPCLIDKKNISENGLVKATGITRFQRLSSLPIIAQK